MDKTLPIYIMPSRQKWGLLALAAAALFAFLVYFLFIFDPGNVQQSSDSFLDYLPADVLRFLYYAMTAFGGAGMIYAGWECIYAPPRMIIDEDGVGGRFMGGGFVGVKRIAWDDITGARLWQTHYLFHSTGVRWNVLYLDVNNDNGKYIPVRKLWHKLRSFTAKLEKYTPIVKDSAFAFDITRSAIDKKQVEEIVAVINSRAKGKPPDEAQESTKSPFAAD